MVYEGITNPTPDDQNVFALICYGIGHVGQSLQSKYQLALLILLKRELQVSKNDAVY